MSPVADALFVEYADEGAAEQCGKRALACGGQQALHRAVRVAGILERVESTLTECTVYAIILVESIEQTPSRTIRLESFGSYAAAAPDYSRSGQRAQSHMITD